MTRLYSAVLEHWSGSQIELLLVLAALFLGIAALYCALAQRWVCREARGHE